MTAGKGSVICFAIITPLKTNNPVAKRQVELFFKCIPPAFIFNNPYAVIKKTESVKIPNS